MQYSVCCVFRAEEATLNDDERARLSDICDVFAHELLPYMNRCLHALFPPTLIAQTLGVSIADLAKLVSRPSQQSSQQNVIFTTLALMLFWSILSRLLAAVCIDCSVARVTSAH